MGQGLTDSPSLFGSLGQPLPYGVKQGQLGDCWFLAAASAVSEEPDRMKNVIVNTDYSASGIFRFNFWVIDKWVSVNIDDRLPVRSWGRGFRPWATWPSQNGAWWMPLLEKAFAKLDQNYDRIIGGNGAEGLRTLTGKPTFSLRHAGKPKWVLKKAHKFWAENNFPATASCCNRVAGGIDGLVSGHAYTFLDVKDLVKPNGGKITLAKVRNPWGKEKYKGPWNDNDSRWTDDFKQQANLTVADDGIFWMPYKNFVKFFSKADVAFTGEYNHVMHKYHAAVRQKRIVVNNPVKQKVYITGETFSERHYPRAGACKPNNNIVLYFLNTNHSPVDRSIPYQFIAWWGFGTVGKVEGELPAGKYYMYIVNQNHPRGPNDITLNVYASNQQPTLEGL